MFGLKRKLRNRRIGREYVLDVKLRSSKVRVARVRMLAFGLSSFFAVVLGAWLIWFGAEWCLNTFVYRNKTFAVEQVDIQTDGVLSYEQIRRWTGLRGNENLLALDLGKVERNLKMAPVIQSVSVVRVLPRKLQIRVVEREPVAQINVPRPKPTGGFELAPVRVDPEGWVMLPIEDGQRAHPGPATPEQFPVISGINPAEVQPGRRLDSPQVQAALQLILAFDRSPMAGLVDLKRVDVSSPDVLMVSTGQGSEIIFPVRHPERQLARWREIFDPAQRLGKAIATLDLAVTNNLPVTFVDTGPTPVSSPKTPNPHPSRKKHV